MTGEDFKHDSTILLLMCLKGYFGYRLEYGLYGARVKPRKAPMGYYNRWFGIPR